MIQYIAIEANWEKTVVGLWCPACAKPSLIQAPMLCLDDTGVSECGMFEGCVDCGDFDEEEGEDGNLLDRN